jgi:hypothetical protein
MSKNRNRTKKIKQKKKKTKKKHTRSKMRFRLMDPPKNTKKLINNLSRQLSSRTKNFKKYEEDCKELIKNYDENKFNKWFLDNMQAPGGWTEKCFEGETDSCNKCKEILNYDRKLSKNAKIARKEAELIKLQRKLYSSGDKVLSHPPVEAKPPSDMLIGVLTRRLQAGKKTQKKRGPKKKKKKKKKNN